MSAPQPASAHAQAQLAKAAPTSEGFATTTRLRLLMGGLVVVQLAALLTTLVDPASVLRALFAGAEGVLPIRPTAAALFIQSTALVATLFLWWRLGLVLAYRAVPSVGDDQLPTVTVIVPAYNEGRQVLRTLRSIALSNYPKHKLQVVAVDDGSKDDTWHWICEAARELGGHKDLLTTYRRPQNGGKRHALKDGYDRARGDVYVTVDSDSEVLPDTLRNLVSPFVVDARVGAVAGNIRVLDAGGSILGRMLDVSFTTAFEFVRKSESRLGMVMCCPGALSAWRADLVDGFVDEWVDQTFWGRPANIGEDRAMTNQVLRRGGLVRFQDNAIVLTTVPTTLPGLARMFLRWGRSNVRESVEMARFVFTPFRAGARAPLRMMFVWSVLQMMMQALLFVPSVLVTLRYPALLPLLVLAALAGAALPFTVYAAARGFGRRALWAFPWAVLSTLTLSWIGLYALLTVGKSGWLTRNLPNGPKVAASAAPALTLVAAGNDDLPGTLDPMLDAAE